MSVHSRIARLAEKYALHIRNVVYFVTTRAMAIVAFVLVVPFFIRHASEQQYGLAAIGFSLLTIATILDVAFGYVLVQTLGRQHARGRKPATNIILGLFSCYLILAGAVALCCLVVIFALSLSMPEILLYGSLAALLPALCVSGVVAAVFQARNQLKPINLSRFGFELAKAMALAISGFVARDISLMGPTLMLAAYLRATLDVVYLARKTGIRLQFRGASQARRYFRLARNGISSFSIVAITAIVTIGDKLLIRNVFDADAVAHYSIAYDVNTKAYLLVYAVNTAMYTVMLHRFARKSNTFAPLAAGLVTVSIVAALYYLPMVVFAPTLLSHWVSAEFAQAATPLARIMSLASLFYLYGNVFENSLTAMGRAHHVLRVYLMGIAIYGLAAGFSIWHHALVGFMYSYLALSVVLCLGFVLQYRAATRSSLIPGALHAGA